MGNFVRTITLSLIVPAALIVPTALKSHCNKPTRIHSQGITMTAENLMSEEQLIRHATDTLIKNLGITEATRFLTLKHLDRLESVERHRQWQDGLEKEQFFDEVFTQKQT